MLLWVWGRVLLWSWLRMGVRGVGCGLLLVGRWGFGMWRSVAGLGVACGMRMWDIAVHVGCWVLVMVPGGVVSCWLLMLAAALSF